MTRACAISTTTGSIPPPRLMPDFFVPENNVPPPGVVIG